MLQPHLTQHLLLLHLQHLQAQVQVLQQLTQQVLRLQHHLL
jgi:hypothetical protein